MGSKPQDSTQPSNSTSKAASSEAVSTKSTGSDSNRRKTVLGKAISDVAKAGRAGIKKLSRATGKRARDSEGRAGRDAKRRGTLDQDGGSGEDGDDDQPMGGEGDDEECKSDRDALYSRMYLNSLTHRFL